MFKSQMIVLVVLLLTLSATAQNDQPVVLVSSTGKVCYQSPAGGKYQKVQTGALLRNTGMVKLSRKSTATIYCNGKFETLAKGQHAMGPIFGEASSMRKLNFDSKFGDYLVKAVMLAAAAQGHNAGWANIIDPKKGGDGWGVTDPKKGGDGWGVTDPKKGGDGWGVTDPKKGGDGWGVTDPKKGGDGWGGLGSKITSIMPFGKVLPATVRFSWSKPANAASYQLEITDTGGKVVHSATARDTFLNVDLAALSLTPGALYSWKVTVPGSASLVSNTLQFAVDSKENHTATMERLAKSSLYSSADAATRGLMEALALEDDDWFLAASDTYAGLKRYFPKNNMVRMMYAAFWVRYGLRPLADAAVMP